MGKSFGGVFANWSGKVGNVVGRILCGENVYSIYQPNVSNPDTNSQRAVRQKFTLLVKAGSAMGAAVKVGFNDAVCGNRWMGGFVSANQEAVSGTYPAQVIDYTKLKVSRGTLLNPVNPGASLGSNELEVSWVDNTGQGGANADDAVRVVLYNTVKGTSVYAPSVGERAAGAGVASYPSTWSGDNFVAYLFCTGKEGISESVYLGSFTA